MQYSQKMKKDSLDREVKTQAMAGGITKVNEQGDQIEALERLSLQAGEIEQDIERLKGVISDQYADLPTVSSIFNIGIQDIEQARQKLNQLKEEVKYKEDVLRKKLAQA